MEDDPTGGKFAGAATLLNGAAHKLEDIINFHVGDLVTSLQSGTLQPGGQEALVYATVMGSVGGTPCVCTPWQGGWVPVCQDAARELQAPLLENNL